MADEGKKPEMVVMVEEKSGDGDGYGDGVFASSSSNTSSPSHMNKHVAPPPMVLVETSPEYFVSEMGSAEEYATHMFSDENANNVCIVMWTNVCMRSMYVVVSKYGRKPYMLHECDWTEAFPHRTVSLDICNKWQLAGSTQAKLLGAGLIVRISPSIKLEA